MRSIQILSAELASTSLCRRDNSSEHVAGREYSSPSFAFYIFIQSINCILQYLNTLKGL